MDNIQVNDLIDISGRLFVITKLCKKSVKVVDFWQELPDRFIPYDCIMPNLSKNYDVYHKEVR
jgi:hypothetical protein